MERYSMSTTIKKQLESSPEVVRQAFLLLAVLKEMLYLLLSLLNGSVSIQDAHARFQPLPPVSEQSISPNLVGAVRSLYRAVVQRDHKAVSRMLGAAPRLVGKRHAGGWFVLHAAVLTGDAELVKIVLPCPKADVNARYKAEDKDVTPTDREYELGTRVEGTNGATPLHYACMIGNVEIIRLLIDHGALFNAKDSKGRDPLEYFDAQRDLEAMSNFHELYVQWKQREAFYREDYSVDELAQLIREDKYEVFENFIRKKPDVVRRTAYTYYDFTLLHLAVIRQRRRFVELLIATDPSLVNKRDIRQSYSSDSSHDSFAPANIPHRYVKGATPLHYACFLHDTDISKMLLEAGADWTIEDFKGRKPEELLYDIGETMNELKSMFAQLRDAEEEKRKKAEEEERRKAEEEERRKAEEEEGPREEDEGNDNDKGMDVDDYKSECSEEYDMEDADTDVNTNDTAPSRVTIESLLSFETTIQEKLVGQRGPIRSVANAIRLRESQWVDPDRPLTMLFLGSSGVGKTELAKQLALFIHGKDGMSTQKGMSISELEKNHGFVRLDMSEYQLKHSVTNLTGAPKSYVGYGEGGALTRPLKKNPKAVVLLDEIEKAHPDVLATFLQVFDDGRISDSKDGLISCKEAIFIMTSNIATDEIKEASPMLREFVARSEEEGRPESYVHLIQDFTRSIRPQLKYHLKRDEFVGRINQIVVFLPLNQEEIEIAVQRELEMWRKRAEEKQGIKLTWTNEVVRKLSQSYDINYGVRSVANEVQRIAVQLVADAHIRGLLSEGSQASLTTNNLGDVVMNATGGPGP